MERPRFLSALLVSVFATAALLAVLYAAAQIVRLPFPAFDLFDWVARVLPGAVITFGIDSMVGMLRRLPIEDLSAVAKLAERTLAVAALFAILAVAGTFFIRFLPLRRPLLSGALTGALIGGALVFVRVSVDGTAATPLWLDALWIIATLSAWGTLLAWGGLRIARSRTEQRSAVERLDRRRFLIRFGVATATITVVGAVVGVAAGEWRRRQRMPDPDELWSANHALPNADAETAPVPGTRPELTPLTDHYRVDINTAPPEIDGDTWRLEIGGMVQRPLHISLDDLRNRYTPMHQFITLSCISNPIAGPLIGTTRWTGVPLGDVLAHASVDPSATHLRVRSADGFHEVVAIEDVNADPRIMLTYAWDGVPLPVKHGFPLRIYRPDRYGMKQPKWIEAIEAIPEWKPGYWVERGWSREAWMQATSVIDVIGSDMLANDASSGSRVPIGGIADAGARGISRVEVKVDDGPWEEAEIREPLSDTTWVIWRHEWPFRSGEHTFTVRCFDGNGTPQVVERTPPHPDGATGLHSKSTTGRARRSSK